MADLGPNKKRIAQLFACWAPAAASAATRSLRWSAHAESEGISWSDIGDVDRERWRCDDGKYTEERNAGIRPRPPARKGSRQGSRSAWRARAMGRQWSGHAAASLRRWRSTATSGSRRLKDDKQREFVSDMYVITQRGTNLSLGRLGYLASIYIQLGGRI